MIKMILNKIDQIEPLLPLYEPEYRKAHYYTDLKLITVVLVVICLMNLLWLFKDKFVMLTATHQLYGLFLFRAAFIAASIVFIYFQKNRTDLIINIKLLFFVALILVMHQSVTLVFRPLTYPFTSMTSVLLILCLYLIFPFSLKTSMALAIPMSVFEIMYVAVFKDYPSGGKFTVISAIIFINLISIFFSARFYTGRRKHFMNYMHLKKAKLTMDKMYKTIAHDIRAPFSGLISYSDLLISAVNSGDKEKIKDISEKIQEVILKTYFLIENLLEWAGRETIARSSSRSQFIINDAVNDAVELFMPLIIKKEISLNLELNGNIIVNEDSRGLNAVIRNLVHNAIKFTNEKGQISINTKKIEEAIVIEIFNSGTLIDPDIVKNAMDVLTGKSEDVNSSSGMGLGICFDIANRNNWEISISPFRNIGTVAQIAIIPLIEEVSYENISCNNC
jgi:signal transduction histidine kinase